LFFSLDLPEGGRGTHGIALGPDLHDLGYGVRNLCPGPGGRLSRASADLHVLNGRVFFSAQAETPIGKALWRSDGTVAGTQPLLQISGAPVPGPQDLTVAGSRAFFHAGDGPLGQELWVTDGTRAGTHFVKDIWPGEGHSRPKDFCACETIVFFQAHDGAHGIELWRTDGTDEGTWMVKDIWPGTADSAPAYMRCLGNVLLFAAADETHGIELWRTDGTNEGTVLVKDVYEGPIGSALYQPTVYGNALLFAANHPDYGEELWRSDGTDEGTVMVKDIRPGAASSEPYHLAEFSGRVYFSANDGVHGEELWCTDGTAEGTRLAVDVYPRVRPIRSSNPTDLTAAGGTLFFVADDVASGEELWCSDPATRETRLVKDIRPGPARAIPRQLVGAGGRLFFVADDGTHGVELWVSDGAEGGTMLVADLRHGTEGSNPEHLAVLGPQVVFAATADDGGPALYRLEPPHETPERLAHVWDFVPGGTVVGLTTRVAQCVTCVLRPEGDYDFLFWDGTLTNVRRAPFQLPRHGSWSHAMALADTEQPTAAESFQRDLLRAYLSAPALQEGRWARTDDAVYFAAYTREHGTELWKSDGTVSGVSLVADCFTGSPSGGPAELTVVGNTLYFAAEHATLGREVWRSDGTPLGTRPMQDWQTSGPKGAGPRSLASLDGTLVLAMRDEALCSLGHVLAKTDDTHPDRLATVQRRCLKPHAPFNPQFLTAVGGYVYFSGSDAARGTELWRSDGTEQGTVMVKNILPDPGYRDFPEIE